ncbi:MAG TPA: hypothetical protein VED24_04970 [Candidatus Acidoferrum sp.]|nr:hypothetical protein [Candidatus Acidoferrum sp.]
MDPAESIVEPWEIRLPGTAKGETEIDRFLQTETHHTQGRIARRRVREWMQSRGKVFVSVAFNEGQDWKYTWRSTELRWCGTPNTQD